MLTTLLNLDCAFNNNWKNNRTVFISFPKSGRTWMRYVFHLIGLDVTFDHAFKSDNIYLDFGEDFPGVKKDIVGRRNIFMYRNALDTAVSFYFQVHEIELTPFRENYLETIEHLRGLDALPPQDIDSFVLHPSWGVDRICRYNRAWLDFGRKRNNFFILSYEEARSNTKASLEKMLAYLGVKGVDIDNVVEKSSFQNMRAKEKEGRDDELRLHGPAAGSANALKVRRGKVSGYQDDLKQETIAKAREIGRNYGFEL